MAKTDIWMPWYITDYMRDTGEFTVEEDCFYRRALDQCWIRRGGIPEDDSRLTALLRFTPGQFKRCRWILNRFFYLGEGGFRNARLDIELEKAALRKEIAGENGRRGGRPKNPAGYQKETQRKPSGLAAGNPEHNPDESSSPSPSFPLGKKTQGVSRPKFTPPTLEEVSAYCAERGNKIDPGQFIDHYEARGWKLKGAVMVSWQAAIRTWEKNDFGKGATSGTHRTTRSQRLDADAEQLLRDIGAAPEGDRSAAQADSPFSGSGNTISSAAVTHGG